MSMPSPCNVTVRLWHYLWTLGIMNNDHHTHMWRSVHVTSSLSFLSFSCCLARSKVVSVTCWSLVVVFFFQHIPVFWDEPACATKLVLSACHFTSIGTTRANALSKWMFSSNSLELRHFHARKARLTDPCGGGTTRLTSSSRQLTTIQRTLS